MWLRSDCVIEEHYGRCLVAKSKCALPLRSRRIRSRLNCIDAGSVKRLSRHKPLVACRQAPALFIPRPLDLGIKSAGDTLFLSLIRHSLLDKRGWSRDQFGVRGYCTLKTPNRGFRELPGVLLPELSTQLRTRQSSKTAR